MKFLLGLTFLLGSLVTFSQIQINTSSNHYESSDAVSSNYVDIYWNGESPIKLFLNEESQFVKPSEKKRFSIDPDDGYSLKLQTASDVYKYDLFLMFDKGENILVVDLVRGNILLSTKLKDFVSSQGNEVEDYDSSFVMNNSVATNLKREELSKEFLDKVPSNPTEKTHYLVKRDNGSIQQVMPLMVNNEFNGTYVMYHKNNVVSAVGEFYKNQINGRLAIFDKQGKLLTISVYSNNKLMSMEVAWDELGNELHFPNLIDGTGFVDYYYPAGGVANHLEYKNGLIDGSWKIFHNNGQLKSHVIYKSGLPFSIEGSFNEDGSLKNIGTLKNGTGTYMFFDENDKLLFTQTYKNGQLQF